MRVNSFVWSELSSAEQERLLQRSQSDIRSVEEDVRDIVEAVARDGDAAVHRFTEQFDATATGHLPLAVTEDEFAAAERQLSDSVKEALSFAISNIHAFHTYQRVNGINLREIRPGVFAGERVTAIQSVGLYVPRGRGSFPSMLYMLAVPAKIAGVPHVSVSTPPAASDGTVDPACLYAASLCGVDTVYRVGGAQAVAALAYGTESIRAVHKLIGPGSIYVAAAKRLVSHTIDTGLPAGPSESIVVADESADPWKVALDLTIEAEHGSDSSALLVTPSAALGESVRGYVEEIVEQAPEPRKGFLTDVFTGYGGVIITESTADAVELVNRFAPEHLQIQTADPYDTLSQVQHAGEILIGEHTPFSMANYAAGANAVLPTGGGARTFSAVSVRDFVKHSSVVHLTARGYDQLAPHVTALADYEGFHTHAEALRRRPESRRPKN
jgi:histidinol dehydrogenase